MDDVPASVVWLMYGLNWIFPVILIPISLPLINEKVKPNLMYGFRTKKTLSNVEIWYKANKYAGKVLLNWSIVVAVGLVLILPVYLLGFLSAWSFMIVGWIITYGALIAAVVMSMLYLRKL